MTLRRYVGCILRGSTIADLPAATTYWTDWWFWDEQTGNNYTCNGTTWNLVSGPSHPEELLSKTIVAGNNNLVGFVQDPFSSQKREGFHIPSLSAQGSLKYALKGWSDYGSYSYVDDDLGTDGKISRFSTSIVENIGYASNSTTQIVSRMAYNTTFKTRVKPSTTSNVREYVGFSSNSSLPTSDTPLGNTESGIILGFNSSATNFSIYRNDGTGAAPTPATFSTTKNTAWHNFEIIMSGNPLQIQVLLDDANLQTFTTRIPALATNLYLNCQLQNITATSKNFDISKMRFNSNLT